ncbi:MAG: hypothetical protein A3F11_05550 [Gammaproteobacteria bacterium RIFCSPHIGHO2_12_FULL_37_14]|nr:MAG: hypothetical protein A3F11_05550 [Gammaproteobacteria bacterium RIFCSPHIGHO2_12_FULL_37_14]
MPNENKSLNQEPTRFKWANIGIYFSTFAIIILIFAASYAYFRLTTITITLTKIVANLENKFTGVQNNFTILQRSVNDFETTIQKSQELANKQEQILADWQTAQEGNLDKWHIAEAQHLVRLASDHAQLPNAQAITIALLQRASQALQHVKDPQVATLQKTLAADITTIENQPSINVNELYLQLSNVDKQLNQLPLPIMQVKQDSALTEHEKTTTSWWQKGLNRSWQMLKQVVVVHYNGTNTLPLIIPDEKIFLYQNLHAKIENAMWGLLHHNPIVYQSSLQSALDWIQQYFVQDAEITRNVIQNLQLLQKINVQPSIINLSATLQLFDDYVVGGKIPPNPSITNHPLF